ncbi:MAG: sensor histidine kinase, partial [Oscillospiraceae bacterium]
AIIFFMLLSGSYFISSIVIPVGEIGKTARKIAHGNFNTRLEKKNDDEIGNLCEAINYMAEELGNTEKMKNEFISSVSHELRTPLTAIKGWSETILDAGDDQETIQKGMRVIISETDRLSLMVEELLDFSRMQSGRLKLIIEKIDLLAELEEAVLMYTEKARREQLDLQYEEQIEAAVVMADKNRLRQVFINIIDNAIKYSDAGGQIRILAASEGDFYVVSVSDTGCGISPEDLPKIKQKFYKANLTRRGSGIGLAVADELVTAFGGTLNVQSTLGQGTTVIIRIPTARRYEIWQQSLQTPEKGGEEQNH